MGISNLKIEDSCTCVQAYKKGKMQKSSYLHFGVEEKVIFKSKVSQLRLVKFLNNLNRHVNKETLRCNISYKNDILYSALAIQQLVT